MPVYNACPICGQNHTTTACPMPRTIRHHVQDSERAALYNLVKVQSDLIDALYAKVEHLRWDSRISDLVAKVKAARKAMEKSINA